MVFVMEQVAAIPLQEERKIIAKYIRQVNKAIIATQEQKRHLFNDLQADIRERMADGRIAGYEDIVAHFGTPEQVAKDFFATVSIKELKKKLLFKEILVFAVLLCLFVFIFYRLFMEIGAFDGIHRFLELHAEGMPFFALQ